MRKESIQSKKILICLSICALCFILLPPLVSSADTGPHPSLYVSFVNLSDKLCYATVLSEEGIIGPLHAYWGTEETKIAFFDDNSKYNLDEDDFEYKIWQAFVDYDDIDGFYFLQMWTNVSANKKIDWRWWAPDRFKILLYYPESNRYAVSGICERYAYDSYFTVDMKETDLVASYNGKDSVAFITSIEKTYPYPWGKEILSLLARVSITVALEVGIALLFRLRQRKTLLVIIMTNVVTQILLNVTLNIYVILYSTDHRFIFFYMMLELLIFISEATVYCLLLNKYTEKKHIQAFYVAYSLVANAVSFLAGIGLAHVIPSIF